MTLIPKRLDPASDQTIRIEWNNGEAFTIPYLDLRFECPCAVCVDEHTGKRIITRDQIAKDIRVRGAELVGKYAIKFNWSDGHSTGMYHYDTLYQLCQNARPLNH